jgi:uncharacterized protein YdeI (YjbR/CyaY-like superfamily)
MATFFETADDFRLWLEEHAAGSAELVVGFYKKGGGRPSLSWPEAVDEALCVGWIDGVRKRIDEDSYQIRFTARKPGSTWSAVNIEKVRILQAQGRMKTAGLEAFARRSAEKSGTYSYEQSAAAELEPAEEAQFRMQAEAWAFFAAQAPGYRKRALWWVVSAKQAATRKTRLARLIELSQKGQRL